MRRTARILVSGVIAAFVSCLVSMQKGELENGVPLGAVVRFLGGWVCLYVFWPLLVGRKEK